MQREIYDRNINTVYKICLMYMKNTTDAEDASSAVFLKYLEKSPHFESLAHERAYFITCAKNHCKDIFKSFWRAKRDFPETIPEQAALDIEETELTYLLFNMPEKYRIPIYLHYFEGYQTKEIAQLMSLNENTVRTRLARGRALLKIELEGVLSYE